MWAWSYPFYRWVIGGWRGVSWLNCLVIKLGWGSQFWLLFCLYQMGRLCLCWLHNWTEGFHWIVCYLMPRHSPWADRCFQSHVKIAGAPVDTMPLGSVALQMVSLASLLTLLEVWLCMARFWVFPSPNQIAQALVTFSLPIPNTCGPL